METDPGFWRGRRVCVTGGTGFLGFQIVRQLLEVGAEVRVLSLPPDRRHPLLGLTGVELEFGDIRDPAVVRRSLGDRQVVFHTAGLVADWGPALGKVHEVHAVGTRNVVDAMPRGSRLVHTSSVVTVGASRTPEPLDEAGPFRLGRLKVDYVHAKLAAEAIALEGAAAGRDVVVTNPGYLLGPEDYERSVMGRFCSRYWRGQVPLAPPGGFNLVDVRDVARGHLAAAERGRSGRRYILGGENRTFPEFMARLAEVGGLSPRAFPVLPCGALTILAGCAEARALVTRTPPYPSLQQSRLNRYYWFYRSDRAAEELGYQARPLADCLADTRRWYAPIRDYRVRGLSRWWMRPEAPSPAQDSPTSSPHGSVPAARRPCRHGSLISNSRHEIPS